MQQGPLPPPCNLFNQLISSSGSSMGSGSGTEGGPDKEASHAHSATATAGGGGGGRRRERLALAGGHEVLVPAGSRFLMSDIRQLQPLLDDAAGKARQLACSRLRWAASCCLPAVPAGAAC